MVRVRMLRVGIGMFVNYVYVGVDEDTKKAFVVDPAWDLKAIERCLDEEGASLNKVFVTHSHFDHCNLADVLAGKYGVPVYVSEREADYYGFDCRNAVGFQDEETVMVGETAVRCLVTPGHSKGSTCYLVENNLFSGDTVFIEGCGACKFDGGSAEEMYESIQRIERTVSEEVLIYPGHRYVHALGVTMEFVKDHNIYFCIKDIDKFVEFRNRKNIKGQFTFR